MQKKKTIGLMGGMGPAATVDFYRRIVESTDAGRDQDHLHVIVDSQPLVPDRTAFLLGHGEDPAPTLVAMAQTLERAGADVLIMACNTAHAFAPQVAVAVDIPLVELPREAAVAVAGHLPGVRRVGLLATTGTVVSGLYQRALAAQGLESVVPDHVVQERVMDAIYGPLGVKAGADQRQARHMMEEVGAALVAAGAQALLLACTELSVLFADSPLPCGAPVVDAAQVAVERVIRLAGGRVRSRSSPAERPVGDGIGPAG